MSETRKDHKNRVLRKGECQRKDTKKYVYTYTDITGVRRSIYDDDLLSLREKEDQINKANKEGVRIFDALSISFEQCYEKWIDSNRRINLNTKCTYMNNYRLHIQKALGRRKIANIRFSDIVDFYNILLDDGMKFKTLELVHTVVHSVFQYAMKDSLIITDPSAKALAEVKVNNNSPDERQPLTIEQQRSFLKYIKGSEKEKFWYHVFVFLLGTGCRIGEALGLTWKDVDFENRTINIDHQLKRIYINEQHRSITKITPPKNPQSVRKIPMMNEVYNVLMEEREFQDKYGHCREVIDNTSDFVFFINDDHVLNDGTCNSAINRISLEHNEHEKEMAALERREAIILPHFSVHNLRHTYCTRLCENDLNIKVIQSLMGHSNIGTTMNIYAKATENKKKQVVEELEQKVDLF